MGWVDDLQGQTVGIDTSPLIYYLEEHPKYLSMVDPFFDALADGEFNVVTSTVSLLEVLVVPIRRGDVALAQQYRNLLLGSRNLTLRPVSVDVAEEAAQLRAQYGLRTPDALQMATALRGGAGFFLTNDARLPSPPGLTVLVLDALR